MSKKMKWFLTLLVICSALLSMNVYAAPRFSVSASSMKKSIAKYSMTVEVAGEKQRFAFKTSDITSFKIKSRNYNSSKKTETVQATVIIDRDVASVKANAKLVYKYSSKKWKLSSVSFSGTKIYKIKLKGKWKGTYIATQGKTRTDIVVNHVTADGYLDNGVFYFSAVPTNPSVPSGSYTLMGGYEKETGTVVFAGDEWIKHPSGYVMIEIKAHVDLKNKKIVSGSKSYYLDLKRER